MKQTKLPARAGVNKIIIAALICLVLAFAGLIAWTVWGNTALTVNEITVASDRLSETFSGYRIAHLSDLHNAQFGDENEDLLDMLKDCRPDLIAITGDFVDSRHMDMDIALHFAEEAVKIAPTYYVPGNHEARIGNYGELKKSLIDSGIVVLEDEAAVIERNGETLLILGLLDPDFTIKGEPLGEVSAMVDTNLKELLDGKTGYTILLSHRPELFDTYVSCGIDLALCGHAHGGQFRLPFIGGLYAPGQGFFPKYDAGLYSAGTTSMVVSRGLGNSVIPMRFNNRPEIVLTELTAKN